MSGQQTPDEVPGLWAHSQVPSIPALLELPAAVSLGLACAGSVAYFILSLSVPGSLNERILPMIHSSK